MLYYLWNTGLPANQIAILICAYLIAISFALSIHELAHGLVAYWCGDRTAKAEGRLSLNPLKHLDPLGTFCLLVYSFQAASISCCFLVSTFIFAFALSGVTFLFQKKKRERRWTQTGECFAGRRYFYNVS